MNKVLLPLCFLLYAANAFPQTWKLLGDFQDAWRQQWKERKFTTHPTEYEQIQTGGRQVVRAYSRKSASGLWRMVDIQPVPSGMISWSWKVEHSLSSNHEELRKDGDDYAARVFVVFEPHFLRWRTRSICYVWASHQSVGSIYASPYSRNVGTVVLESGDKHAGEWIEEKRDFIADYKKYFGEAPARVSAVAFMTDTDNTRAEATAYFGDIILTIP